MSDEPPNLFDAYKLARTEDPDTSKAAAQSQKAVRMSAVRTAIHQLLWRHREGLTDNDIARLYDGPPVSPSGLRTRRAELVDGGLVRDSGQRAVLGSGRKAILWEVNRRA